MEEEKQNIQEEVIKQVEKSIKEIADSGVTPSNLDNLGKLVDIHKDLKHEKYMEIKEEEIMRYGTYGRDEYGESYNGGRRRDSMGRYMEGSYGRRGVRGTGRGRYRGEEVMEDMYNAYQDYNDGKEMYNESGSYGAKEDSIKGLEDMMGSITECVTMIFEEAEPEEKEVIRKHIKKMSQL